MNQHILITYASKYGSTGEVAEEIGKVLGERKATVDIRPVSQVKSIEGYDVVIVGAPMYSGEWLPEMAEFVSKNYWALQEKKTACFVLSMRLASGEEVLRALTLQSIESERVILNPLSIGLFGGRIDLEALSPITRLVVETKGMQVGDLRDWKAIRAWAENLAGLLLEMSESDLSLAA